MRFYHNNIDNIDYVKYIESLIADDDELYCCSPDESVVLNDDNIPNFVFGNCKINTENKTISTIKIVYFILDLTDDTIQYVVNLCAMKKNNLSIQFATFSEQMVHQINQKMSNIQIDLIHYQYNENEINKLKQMKEIYKNNIDCSINSSNRDINCRRPRNNYKITQINDSNLLIYDEIIAKSKITADVNDLYNSLKLDKWMFVGCPIHSVKNNKIDVPMDVDKHVLFWDVKTIQQKIFTNIDKYNNNVQLVDNNVINEIIDNRKRVYTKFRDSLLHINNNLRIFCPKYAYVVFKEYIDSFITNNDTLIQCNYTKTIQINDDITTNIFIGKRAPKYILPSVITSKIKIIFINTEQATLANTITTIVNIAEMFKSHNNPNVVCAFADYSQQNIKIIKPYLDKYNLNIYHIPYQYNKTEINKLKEFKKAEKKYTCVTCGTKTYHRSSLYNQIKKKHIFIQNISGFDEIRDREIARSDVLLNIHCGYLYNIFESIRCDRWIFAGHFILSENSSDDESYDLKDFITFRKSEEIPQQICSILDNEYVNYIATFENKKKILDQIIENRKSLYNNFREIF